jgi:hypothetical protein
MKTKIAALFLLTASLMAEQKTLVIPVNDGKAQTVALDKELKNGWKVVFAVPVTTSQEVGVFTNVVRSTYTTQIVVILTNDHLPAEKP